jgi:hypothetical protein
MPDKTQELQKRAATRLVQHLGWVADRCVLPRAKQPKVRELSPAMRLALLSAVCKLLLQRLQNGARELSNRVESSFVPVLITYSKTSDNATETNDNTGANMCSQ